jgi:hypothetical protein
MSLGQLALHVATLPGQLADFIASDLRLLDVPVPSVYGPTADKNPFAGAA